MAETVTPADQEISKSGVRSTVTAVLARSWPWVAVVSIAVLAWLPRLTGPIDLRWDAGVYYVLGTSLASGQGCRILSEPGAPESVQYPPVLPVAVAAVERVLHSSDPSIVGPLLRKTYFLIYIVYGLAVFALAQRYLDQKFALVVTIVSLLHVWAIFLSDLLFAELPFALVSVVFIVLAAEHFQLSWVGKVGSFGLAAAGFLLRTVGAVLFVAWIAEGFLQRRWKRAFVRLVLAIICIAGWQVHLARIRESSSYKQPAYNYQRAAYQNYNVTYFENIALLDPFRPELGNIGLGAMIRRIATNVAIVPAQLGEAISAPLQFWKSTIPGQNIRDHLITRAALRFVIIALGILVISGFVLSWRCGEWRLVTLVCSSTALLCLTPWPEEFHRYLMPLGALLAIAAALAVQAAYYRLSDQPFARRWIGLSLAGLLALSIIAEACTALRFLAAATRAKRDPLACGAHFFHGGDWVAWEQAVEWIKSHAAQTDIVATTAPHQLYLRSGLHAVYPPFTADPKRAARQLSSVPVNYVLVDEFRYRDFSRRYALPAVKDDPSNWQLVYAIGQTQIFQNKRGSSVTN